MVCEGGFLTFVDQYCLEEYVREKEMRCSKCKIIRFVIFTLLFFRDYIVVAMGLIRHQLARW